MAAVHFNHFGKEGFAHPNVAQEVHFGHILNHTRLDISVDSSTGHYACIVYKNVNTAQICQHLLPEGLDRVQVTHIDLVSSARLGDQLIDQLDGFSVQARLNFSTRHFTAFTSEL
uniref:Uncharacterized protein n=1 Tax=Cacopsylla melanoneura TaxID=428564 RepID=A0A8D8UD06_9HEMI